MFCLFLFFCVAILVSYIVVDVGEVIVWYAPTGTCCVASASQLQTLGVDK